MIAPPSGAIPVSPQPTFTPPVAQQPQMGAPMQQAQAPLGGQVPQGNPMLASMAAAANQPVQQSSPLAGSSQLSQALLAKAIANNQPDPNQTTNIQQPGLLARLFANTTPMSPAAQTAAVGQ